MARVSRPASRPPRAFTIVQLTITLLAIGLLLVIVIPMLRRQRTTQHTPKDGTQIRNVIQAMTIFADGNNGRYPLPSILDVNNQTVNLGMPGDAASQRGKDTTGNILSILVFNSSISPELLYSPSESNSNIMVHAGYQNADPAAAAVPANAVWDPSLRADFTTGPGHISYAHLMPDGDPKGSLAASTGRLRRWTNTFNATEAVFGNRGPLVTGRDQQGEVAFDRKSNTLLIHGGRTTWEGNIGYNDNHVNFETRMDPTEITYPIAGGRGLRPDIFFYNEPDDADGLNAFLGIWVKSGMLPAEFKGIHD